MKRIREEEPAPVREATTGLPVNSRISTVEIGGHHGPATQASSCGTPVSTAPGLFGHRFEKIAVGPMPEASIRWPWQR